MSSLLEKHYDEYKDSGGENAIIGFNFQAYSGLYYMLFYEKNNRKFEIEFEGDDDIILENLETKEKFKIQIKSEQLSLNKIIKEDKNKRNILGKLILNKEYENYVIGFPYENKSLKKISKLYECNLGNECYLLNKEYKEYGKDKKEKVLNEYNIIKNMMSTKNYKEKKLIFQEMKFTKEPNNCYNYLMGMAKSNNLGKEKEINLTDLQLNALLGMIYNISTKKFNKKKFTNDIFKEIKTEEKEKEVLEQYLNLIETRISPSHSNKLRAYIGEYIGNKKYYDSILVKIKIEKYDDIDCFIEYYKKTIPIIEKKISLTKELMLNKYIIGCYILFKIIEEEKNCGC